jgi:hypothetical protein
MVLTTRALNRALLARQHLLERSSMTPAAMIEHLLGLQAQEPPAPYYGLWSRIADFDPQVVSDGLDDRSLVRGTMMRATLHLATSEDYLHIRPQLHGMIRQRVIGSLKRYLVGVDDLDELAAAARDLYREEPRIARAAGRALNERWPDADTASLGYASALVPLVQLPPRGQWKRPGRAILADAESWLGTPLPEPPAPDALVRRYLRAFGPATVADMRMWSGLSGLREVFDRLRPELRTCEDEQGRELFDVPDGLLPDPETPAPPRFLPEFENALLSHDDRSRIIDDEHRRDVVAGHRFFLVDGMVAGRWRVEDGAVVVEPTTPLRKADQRAVDAEARRLAAFVQAS